MTSYLRNNLTSMAISKPLTLLINSSGIKFLLEIQIIIMPLIRVKKSDSKKLKMSIIMEETKI